MRNKVLHQNHTPKVRLLSPHSENCPALEKLREGVWETPWYFNDQMVWRDSRGGRRGRGHSWLVMNCNLIECSAQLIVSALELETQAQEALAALQRGQKRK